MDIIAYGMDRSGGERIMTEADYYNIPDERRVELIDGHIYDMASPGVIHQTVLGELFYLISDYIRKKGGRCRVLPDLDTKLDTDEDTIVRPDISVICDPEKLTDRRCEGSPDWIIEIVSPGNARNDYLRKLELYQRVGIREYWIVDPMKKSVIVYVFQGEDLDMTPYCFDDKITPDIYKDLIIDFSLIDEKLDATLSGDHV